MEKQYVTEKSTHFCYKCGWIDDINTVMEKKTYTDKSGKTQTDYYHLTPKQKIDCPECSRKTVLPMTMGNSVHAITYLMKALR